MREQLRNLLVLGIFAGGGVAITGLITGILVLTSGRPFPVWTLGLGALFGGANGAIALKFSRTPPA